MKPKVEYELNRAWIYDDEHDDTIGETLFVVLEDWLLDTYNKHFKNQYDTFENFLDCYEPETDGEFIYQKAVQDGVLQEDLGVVLND